MSGGSSKSGAAIKAFKPYALSGMNEAVSVYNAAKPGLSGITNTVQSMIPGLYDQWQQGNPMLNSAQQYGQNVLGGQYLNGNPYLQSMIDQTNNDIQSRVGGAFGSRGTFGSTAHMGAMAREMANAENALRYQNYNTERGYQQQAMQSAPQMAAADYLGVTPLLSAAQAGAELPYTGMNNYSSALSQLMNGSVQKQGTLGSVMSGLGTAAGIVAASDPRLKANIEKVGELEDGLGVYRWNYIWDDPSVRFEGVMADEVEALRPWALGPVINGYATVNYGAL